MATFGSVNHVLTNHTPSWGHTWTCKSASGSSVSDWNLLYRLTAHFSSTTNIYDIKFQNGTWQDVGVNAPNKFGTSETNSTTIVPDISHQYLYLWGNGPSNSNFVTTLGNDGYSSGPTVTSHTEGIVITNETITSSHFTWLKDGSTYTPTDLTLIASNTIGANNDTGYIYAFNKTGTAVYDTTIDSQEVSVFYFDASWTTGNNASSGRSTNQNRILNVLATIPSYITIGSGSDLNGNPNPLTTVFNNVSRVITYTYTATLPAGATTIHINFALDNKVINGVSEIIGTFYESRVVDGYTNKSQDYIIGAQQTMTYDQSLLGDTITYSITDWVYRDEPEGDGYVPVTTSSNGGGKRRYPIISTNLFDRQRSIFSIGLTHKDETLF